MEKKVAGKSGIASEATVERSYEQGVYDVVLDGYACGKVTASDLPQARGMVRKALKQAFESEWNQTLIFRGNQEPGQVSRVQFRIAMRDVAKTHGRSFGT